MTGLVGQQQIATDRGPGIGDGNLKSAVAGGIKAAVGGVGWADILADSVAVFIGDAEVKVAVATAQNRHFSQGCAKERQGPCVCGGGGKAAFCADNVGEWNERGLATGGVYQVEHRFVFQWQVLWLWQTFGQASWALVRRWVRACQMAHGRGACQSA